MLISNPSSLSIGISLLVLLQLLYWIATHQAQFQNRSMTATLSMSFLVGIGLLLIWSWPIIQQMGITSNFLGLLLASGYGMVSWATLSMLFLIFEPAATSGKEAKSKQSFWLKLPLLSVLACWILYREVGGHWPLVLGLTGWLAVAWFLFKRRVYLRLPKRHFFIFLILQIIVLLVESTLPMILLLFLVLLGHFFLLRCLNFVLVSSMTRGQGIV